MAWVITSLCQDKVDMACVEVCPVDCIVQFTGNSNNDDDDVFPKNQLYIDPDECINCGVREPECPWEAIFEDEEVPEVFANDIAMNARVSDDRDNFDVPERDDSTEIPSPEDVKSNKQKWGYSTE